MRRLISRCPRNRVLRATPLLFAALTAGLTACSKPTPPQEPVRAVRTTTIAPTNAGGSVDFAGEIQPRIESRLGFRVSGKMLTRPVGLGDRVRAGQVLASLDARDLQLGQESARSSVQASRVSHDQALADFQRFKALRDQGFISTADLERREATLRAAQAQLEQAQAQEGVQNNQVRYSSLIADVAGVVTAVEAEPGAVLSAGAPVLRVAHDGPRDVVFSVPEDQVGAMRSSMGRAGALQVRIWGASGAPIPATVREVAPATDPVTRTFLVRADIGAASVRLGQTATVSIALPVVQGVIKLPLAAVFEHEGQSSVWLLDTSMMTVRAQTVRIAGAEGNQILVADGLTPGQMVVTAGVHVLTSGQKVNLYVETPAMAAVGLAASAAAR